MGASYAVRDGARNGLRLSIGWPYATGVRWVVRTNAGARQPFTRYPAADQPPSH